MEEEEAELRKTAEAATRQRSMAFVDEDHVLAMEGSWQFLFQKIIRQQMFEVIFALLIFSNCILLGVELEFTVASSQDAMFNEGVLDAWFALRCFYTFCFSIELGFRGIALRTYLLWGSESWAWNYLDIFIVFISWIEFLLDILALAEVASEFTGGNSQSFRVMRILRITRMLRVVRVARIVRFVRALQTLVTAIVYTMKALIWAMALLTMIIYVFALLFTQGANDQLIDPEATLTDENRGILHQYWGNLGVSMFTLFKTITNGVDWDLVCSPLEPGWAALFVGYVSFAYFAVLNVVTGVFCQSAIESAQHDQEMVVHSQMKNKNTYIQRTNQLFKCLDSDSSGSISIRELERRQDDPQIQQLFSSLDIDLDDAWTLFKLLDSDNSYLIDAEEFVEGCFRLKGSARSLDMAKLMYEHRWLAKKLLAFIEAVQREETTYNSHNEQPATGAQTNAIRHNT